MVSVIAVASGIFLLCAAVIVVMRRRRMDVGTLDGGSVSRQWLVEHQADDRS